MQKLSFLLGMPLASSAVCIAMDTNYLNKQLVHAVEFTDNQKIKTLLEQGADANSKNCLGQPLLHTAISQGNLEGMQLLLDAHADANGKETNTGITPLIEACRRLRRFPEEHTTTATIVKLLLSYSADPNYICINNHQDPFHGTTALMHAILSGKGRSDVVAILLHAGANPNIQTTYLKETALTMAAGNGYKEIVALLLKNGAHVNLQDKNGFTAAALARQKNHLDIADYIESKTNAPSLLQLTVPLVAQHIIEGKTSLYQLPSKLHSPIRDFLQKNHTRTYEKNNAQLLDAVHQGLDVATLHALLARGANPNCADNAGYTALSCAVLKDNLPALALLLKAGSAVNARNADTSTALMLASQRGQSPLVKLLLQAGANPNTIAHQGLTALLCACVHGHADSAQLLLAHGALVNTQMDDGNTALHLALPYPDVVRILLSYKADYEVENTAGDIPLATAKHFLEEHTTDSSLRTDILKSYQLLGNLYDNQQRSYVKKQKGALRLVNNEYL